MMNRGVLRNVYSVAVVTIFFSIFVGIVATYLSSHELLQGEWEHKDIGDLSSNTVEIDWELLYPFEEGGAEKTEQYADISENGGGVNRLKDRIESYINARIVYRNNMIIEASRLRKLFQWPNLEHNYINSVLIMENGYLTGIVPEVSASTIEEMADNILDFSAFLKKRGIELIYVNAGSKVNPYDKKLKRGEESQVYADMNAKQLLNMLQSYGIDTLDFYEKMNNNDKVNWYDNYYAGDHHWTNRCQLWAAGVLAEKLNTDYSYSYDLSYFDIERYHVNEYKNVFMGAYARELADFSYKEDYSLIIPEFETSFSLDVSTRNCSITGEYAETLLDRELFEQALDCTDEELLTKLDFYMTSGIRDAAVSVVDNLLMTNNEGKKLLFINDSFGWYLAGYMALDVDKLESISPYEFTGSIRGYIEDSKPDMVILLYTSNNIKVLDGGLKGGCFDLR